MAKETIVKLNSQSLSEDRGFAISHAEEILKMQKVHGGDWVLADKNFILKENGTIERAGPGKDKSTQAESSIS